MSRYSSRASSASTARARTSPPPGTRAMRSSRYGNGSVSKSCAMPCRPSTSTSSVRLPPSARPSASAAATVVLPVPPLPVTTCSRAGHLLTCSPIPSRYGRRSAGHLADQPSGLVDHRELQILLGGLLVGGRHGQLHGDQRAVLALVGHGRLSPPEDRLLIAVGIRLDLADPVGESGL